MTESETEARPVNWATVGSAWVIRILFWASTIYVIYFCVNAGYSLITLHVAFFTVGCTLVMVEATLAVTGDGLLVAKVSKTNRVRIHWILHAAGLAAIIVGYAAIEKFKIQFGFPHLSSDHGKVGTAAFVIALVVGIGGIPALNRKLVPQVINFGSFRRTHIYLGIISTILLWAGQITGLFLNWWSASDLITNLMLASYIVGGFLLLGKPLYSTLWRSFH